MKLKDKLFVVADDLTGALDTGVPFAANGLAVRVQSDPTLMDSVGAEDCDVLIVCTRSRHLPSKQAQRVVRDTFFAARQAGVFGCYIKKLDSTLRGNLGAELEGMILALDASCIHVLNAFPAAGRTTLNGVQYVYGQPVDRTSFAKDPFNPIRSANILQTLQAQSPLIQAHPERIRIYDAQTDGDIGKVIDQLSAQGELKTLAGCAGLAAELAKLWKKSCVVTCDAHLPQKPFILCGSLNPAADAQMEWAQTCGAHVETLPMAFLKGDPIEGAREAKRLIALHQRETVILRTPRPSSGQTSDAADGSRMAASMGRCYATLLEAGFDSSFLIIGGDTLEACMDAVCSRELIPLGEPLPGTVLCRALYQGNTRYLLSRAGGFGNSRALVDLLELMKGGISQ